ncbi:MAG: response regulator, partial [Microcoleus sp. SIO2G3]|nr:response regulator [Microcoleus sp. SIO2G3]
IESALETVRLAAEAKSIAIETHVEAIAPVLGDATRLQQAIWNLLSNAIKFTPNGGRVTVRLEAIRDQAIGLSNGSTPNAFARLTVTDTGIGITSNFLPYVFYYFRQEDAATTRKFGGLGLGLAIVRNLVELHGGRVSASSQGEGQGATFTIQLPLMQTSRAQSKGEAIDLLLPGAAPLAGVQILLVDDEADTRDVIAYILEEAGAIFRSASSAIEALQAFEQAKPDVLVSDIGMPDMDGYMLIQQIRARSAAQNGRGTQAIALTAYAGELDQQRALAVGFQRHLAKPVEPDELVNAIAKLVKR